MKPGLPTILLILICYLPLTGGRSQTIDSVEQVPDFSRVIWPEYQAFQTRMWPDTIAARSWHIGLKSTAWFKNNEFKNPYSTGASLLGIWFEPTLEYHPDKRTTIRAGAHLLKYHGRDNFERKVPLLSVRYDATDHFSLIFGTIRGTVEHSLIEPVMNFEKYLVDNYENGLQLLWEYPQFRSDVWLNWEQFLKPGDPFQEHFTAGFNSTFLLYGSELFQVTAPFSTVFRHKGGEFDATNLPASTQLNLTQGIRFNWMIPDFFVRTVALSQYYASFLEINPGDQVTIPYGNGSYTRAMADTRLGSVEVGYWYARNFISPHGMPIFQSVSQDDPLFLSPDRQMLVLKYQLALDLTRFLKIILRFEPYYYYDTGRIDHSWSVYLLYNDRYRISRGKRK